MPIVTPSSSDSDKQPWKLQPYPEFNIAQILLTPQQCEGVWPTVENCQKALVEAFFAQIPRPGGTEAERLSHNVRTYMAAVKALYVGLFDCWLNAFRPALVGHPTSKTYDLGNGLLGRLRAGLESFAHVLWTLQTSSETPLTTPSSSLIHQHGLDRIAMNENDLWEESRVEMLTLLRDAVQAVSGQGGRLKAEQKPAETPVQSAYEARKANAKPKGTKKKPFANFAAWARAKMNERKFPTSFSIEQDSGGRLNHKTIDKILRGEMTKESTRERFCEVLNDIAPGFEPIFLRDAPAD